MIERHYDDEALISLIETNRAAADPHLPSCPPCTAKIESFQTIAEALCDGDVWDTRPVRTEAVPATIATLRAFADRMSDEDTRAEAMLAELLAGSREEWIPRLAEHEEWWTAGVVRKLIARSYATVFSMPPDALALTEIAVTVADQLDPADQPTDTVPRLRGIAWLAQSYALYYVGRFPDAEVALFAAERHFSCCAINEYELARVGVTRALVLRPFGRIDEATAAADASAKTFVRFADANKSVGARVTAAHLLFSREQFQEAVSLLDDVEQRFHNKIDFESQVVILNNLAYGYRKLGQTELAVVYYDMITAIYDERGMAGEAARARWNCAAIAAGAGDLTSALERYIQVAEEFERLGMTSECALVSLDRAEVLLAQDSYNEVEHLCGYAMSLFERSGLSYSTRALTALAFLQEVSTQRKLRAAQISEVREYLRKLPSQPNLLFAPAPSASAF
jgi:tetratricopeptide (TPR) repeat protein